MELVSECVYILHKWKYSEVLPISSSKTSSVHVQYSPAGEEITILYNYLKALYGDIYIIFLLLGLSELKEQHFEMGCNVLSPKPLSILWVHVVLCVCLWHFGMSLAY